MAALLGKAEEFDASKEEWAQCMERMDHFFAANGINDAYKKKSTFLAVIGPTTYTLVRNLVSPEKPGQIVRRVSCRSQETFQSNAFGDSSKIKVSQQSSKVW